MSDEGPIQPSGQPGARPIRPASVTLQTQSQADETAMQLDAANQSLADALKMVFRGVQVAMAGLFVYFLASGVQSIKETESGIQLLFGRVTGDNLPPGMQVSAPYPMGELIRVDQGTVTLEMDDSFMPSMTPDQRKLPISQVAQMGTKLSLKPGEDGSLITGDENIAHTRWKVIYFRKRPKEFVQNILPEDEKKIVQAAVERGVVQAISTIKIDDLLKQSQGDDGSVARRAKEIAQDALNALNSGIDIKQLTLQEKTAPFVLFTDFNGVQSAEQKASQQRSGAESKARNILNEMAGEAYEPLIHQIDLYEAAIAKGTKAEQDEILAKINETLMSEPPRAGDTSGKKYPSGRVSAMLNEARQYRTSIVSRRQAELASFQAKYAQFKSNPDVVIQREWTDAMTDFLRQPLVETFLLPPGTDTAEIVLNRDQDYLKDANEAAKLAKFRAAEIARTEAQKQSRFKTDTSLQELPSSPKAAGGGR